MTVNQSVGLIDVMQADYNALHCHWTIGNVGIPQAVALFIIPSINFSHRRYFNFQVVFFFFAVGVSVAHAGRWHGT